MNVLENYTLPEGCSLGLGVIHSDGRSDPQDPPVGFRWNLKPGGTTIAPEWDGSPRYFGAGLHLWAWARGVLCISGIWHQSDVVWLAVEYGTESAMELCTCIRVPKCRTIAVSPNRKEIISFIQKHTPEGKRGPAVDEYVVEVEEGEVSVGDYGIAVVRGKGTAKTGKGGTAIAGDGGTAIAGDGSTAWVGVGGKAKVGDRGIIRLKDRNQGWVVGVGGTYPDYGYRYLKPYTLYTLDDSGEPVEAEKYTLPVGKSLGLKVVYSDGCPESHYAPEGFRWNLKLGGETEAPDWNPKPECGGGLHLWAWAQGDLRASHIWTRSDVVCLAVEYETSKAVDLRGKVKVPRCKTLTVSPDIKEIITFIQAHTPDAFRVEDDSGLLNLITCK